MMKRTGGALFLVFLLMGLSALGILATEPREAEEGLTQQVSPGFSSTVELPAEVKNVVIYRANSTSGSNFTIDSRQMRPDGSYHHGDGIIFFAAFLIVGREVQILEIHQFSLSDDDLVEADLDGRAFSVPVKPSAALGGTEGSLRAAFPAGESVLVIVAWGAPTTLWLNATGGTGTIAGPFLDAPARAIDHHDFATVSTSLRGWGTRVTVVTGEASFPFHPGDLLVWMGDAFRDGLDGVAGGIYCTVADVACPRVSYASVWGNATIGTRGSLSAEDPDWVLATIIPTGLEPSYRPPNPM